MLHPTWQVLMLIILVFIYTLLSSLTETQSTNSRLLFLFIFYCLLLAGYVTSQNKSEKHLDA